MNGENFDDSSSFGSHGLGRLFPDADYRHQMRFRRGTVQDFFRPWHRPPDILQQRQLWLRHDPASYVAVLPECGELLQEFIGLIRETGVDPNPANVSQTESNLETVIGLGGALEPDFLLLKVGEDSSPRLLGGCVCFPSSWSLEEKMGQPLDIIHSVVPGLDDQLGERIRQFLRGLAPGVAWLRENWGLSRSAELNHHPFRLLPKLDPSVRLDEVWLRVEHQALVALPCAGGILFGIRIAVHPLSEVRQNPEISAGLRRALETMPEQMAHYKGIAPARSALIAMLRGA